MFYFVNLIYSNLLLSFYLLYNITSTLLRFTLSIFLGIKMVYYSTTMKIEIAPIMLYSKVISSITHTILKIDISN